MEKIINFGGNKISFKPLCIDEECDDKMLELCIKNNIYEYPITFIMEETTEEVLIVLVKYYITKDISDMEIRKFLLSKIETILKKTHTFDIGIEFNELIGIYDKLDFRINELREYLLDNVRIIFRNRNVTEIYEKIIVNRLRFIARKEGEAIEKMTNRTWNMAYDTWKRLCSPDDFMRNLSNLSYVNICLTMKPKEFVKYSIEMRIHRISYCIPLKIMEEFMTYEYGEYKTKCFIDFLYVIDNFWNLSMNSKIKLCTLLAKQYPSFINDNGIEMYEWIKNGFHRSHILIFKVFRMLSNENIFPGEIIIHIMSFMTTKDFYSVDEKLYSSQHHENAEIVEKYMLSQNFPNIDYPDEDDGDEENDDFSYSSGENEMRTWH